MIVSSVFLLLLYFVVRCTLKGKNRKMRGRRKMGKGEEEGKEGRERQTDKLTGTQRKGEGERQTDIDREKGKGRDRPIHMQR